MNGILDEETIKNSLSNLGRIADGSKLSYLNLVLPGYSLKNIAALAKFKELQTIDFSYNQLKGCIFTLLYSIFYLEFKTII
jgi:hypothetical protein